MKACNLELHPVKTKIVYCQGKDRREQYVCTQFDFLGYTYHRVLIKDRTGRLQFNFLASVRKNATKSLNASIRAMETHRQTGVKIEIIAEMINPIVRGWLYDFGCYNRRKKGSAVYRED